MMFFYSKIPMLSKIIMKVWKNHTSKGGIQICENHLDQKGYFSELLSFKLAASELTKSMLPKINGWVDDVFISKISYIIQNNHESLQKSYIYESNYVKIA